MRLLIMWEILVLEAEADRGPQPAVFAPSRSTAYGLYFLIKSHPGFQSAKLKLMIYLLQAPIKNTIHNLKCDFVSLFMRFL